MIVTISRQYGAGALDVAHELEHRLGYRVAAEDLPAIAALRMGASRDSVAAVQDRRPPLVERILGNLGAASPETVQTNSSTLDTFDEQARREIEGAVREAAASDDVIIVGRIANMVLRDHVNLLSVFLHAPLDWRIVHVQASLRCDVEVAKREIARVDSARRQYAKTHYGLEWGTFERYDLTLNVGRVGIAGAADIIASAVRVQRS